MIPLLLHWTMLAHAGTVTNGVGCGAGTLFDLLNNGVAEDIDFDPAVTSVTWNGALCTLPAVNELSIDGAGAVRIDGLNAGAVSGLTVQSGDIRGVHITRFDHHGIDVTGSNVTVEDVVVGLDLAGGAAGNCQAPASGAGVTNCAGIHVGSGLSGVVLDGVTVEYTQGSLTSGHGAGVLFRSANTLQGSEVGLNAGRGVIVVGTSTCGTSGTLITSNNVYNNAGSGVFLGSGSCDTDVSDNHIGRKADGSAAGNQTHGIKVFASDDNVISGNVITDNGGSGVEMSGAGGTDWQSGQTISSNYVGLLADGTAYGNDEWGIWSSGNEGGHTISGNTIGNNAQCAVTLFDPGSLVTTNYIGIAADGTDISGSQLCGLRLRAPNLEATDNFVGGHTLAGIRVRATSGETVTGVQVTGNHIGVGPAGEDRGNGDDGIWVYVDGTGVLEDLLIQRNVVSNNVGKGVYLEAGDRVHIDDNVVTANDECGIFVEATANGGITSPTLTARNDLGASFDVATPPLGETISAVHVFWDPDTEARDYLGTATYDSGTGMYVIRSRTA